MVSISSALRKLFQREYYATHQYFLSPRSLYLVMWSLIDGEQGVEGLQQWLINIQVTGFTVWESAEKSHLLSVYLNHIAIIHMVLVGCTVVWHRKNAL